MFRLARRRSSTASTTPTSPTTSAVAVAVAVTATRVVLPTCVTVPTAPAGFEPQTANNLITLISGRLASDAAKPAPHVVLQVVSIGSLVKRPQKLAANVAVKALACRILHRRCGTHHGVGD